MGSSRSQNYAKRRFGPFCSGNGLQSAYGGARYFFLYDSPVAEAHVENFRRRVRDLAPCRLSKCNATSSYVPADLKTSDRVFIREDAHNPSLTNPYRGLYLVQARIIKSSCVQLDSKENGISIDRLNPAYVDISNHNGDTVTCSGRTSRPRQRFGISHPNRGGM